MTGVDFTELAWNRDPAPVAKRPVEIGEIEAESEDEGSDEAPEEIAELDLGPEEMARELVVLIIPIEDNGEDKCPSERGGGAKGTEEGLGDAERAVEVEIARMLDQHLLDGDYNIGESKVEDETVVTSLSVFIEDHVADEDEERAEKAETGAGEADPVDGEKVIGLWVLAVVAVHRFYLLNHNEHREEGAPSEAGVLQERGPRAHHPGGHLARCPLLLRPAWPRLSVDELL